MEGTDQGVAERIVRLLPEVAVKLRLASLFDLGAVDLTPGQVLTLFLVDTADGGRLGAGQISGELAVSMPAATAMVGRLVHAGLLQRVRGEDRRTVWVSLTDRGSELVEELRYGLAERIAAVVGVMDRATQASLVEALRNVVSFAHRLGAAGVAEPQT